MRRPRQGEPPGAFRLVTTVETVHGFHNGARGSLSWRFSSASSSTSLRSWSRHRTNSRPSGRPTERACLLAGGDTTPDYAPADHGTAAHAKALKAVLTFDRADDER